MTKEANTTPRWVYIAGRGHSGSTMLDAMLGNATAVASVGELVSGMGRYDDLCSCGATFEACAFWTDVRQRFSEQSDLSWDVAVSICRAQAHLKMFPPTVVARSGAHWVRRLVAITGAIGAAIAGATGGSPDVVVDSSKEITRAIFFLRFLPEARVVHLMRHPVSILQSDYHRLRGGAGFKFFRKRFVPRRFFGPILFLRTVAWILGNVAADAARLVDRERFLRVKYESIIANPIVEIDRIEAFIGVSLDAVRDRLRRGESFSVGHNIGGNQMRHSGTFRFDPSKAERSGLPVRYMVMAWIMTWPQLLAYGYRGRLRPSPRLAP